MSEGAGAPENVLGRDTRPRFFQVGNAGELGLTAPDPRQDVAVRTFVRSLAGMQKEAVVLSSATDAVWRLVSDEGPYLQGYDEAPFPLAFMAAGMVASYFTEVRALADARGVEVNGLCLTLDNHYTMNGSAIRGTMVGGALSPELHVAADPPVDVASLRGLAADAVDASPLNGLLRGENDGLFTLTHNAAPQPVGSVAALDATPLPDLLDRLDGVTVTGPEGADDLIRRTTFARHHEGVGGAGSSLQPEQKRTLHVRATCRAGVDGVKTIEIDLFKPSGSSFRFRSDEPTGGRAGRAPDAATLASAGIALCFMTQVGRYAAITKRRLIDYGIVQDTHVSLGGASGGAGLAGRAEPVETHVYLDSEEDDDGARDIVDMGERTCFLHATCRTEVKVRLTASATG